MPFVARAGGEAPPRTLNLSLEFSRLCIDLPCFCLRKLREAPCWCLSDNSKTKTLDSSNLHVFSSFFDDWPSIRAGMGSHMTSGAPQVQFGTKPPHPQSSMLNFEWNGAARPQPRGAIVNFQPTLNFGGGGFCAELCTTCHVGTHAGPDSGSIIQK